MPQDKIDNLIKSVNEIDKKVSTLSAVIIEREKLELSRNEVLEKRVDSNCDRLSKIEKNQSFLIKSVVTAIIGFIVSVIARIGGL